MKQCNCGSFAINHNSHGRDGSDDYLCDVCYWRKRAAATDRATQVERERCAALAEKMTNQSRIVHGSMNAIPTPKCNIAAAIRQGGTL